MHPAIRPTAMSRQPSQQSQHGTVDLSSDSLSSMWNPEHEAYFARSTSGSGKLRGMMPGYGDRYHAGHGQRSISSGSERSAPIPARPLIGSNLSQTSLAASPGSAQPVPIPPEFCSAPNHTLNLLQSYATAFPVRDSSGTSASFAQKGFVFSGSVSISPAQSRRGSFNDPIARPTSGTIRAKSRTCHDASWDAYGRHAVAARNAPAMAIPERDRSEVVLDCTPKQSLEVQNGRWKIKYVASTPGNAVRSMSQSSTTSRSSFESDGELHHAVHQTAAVAIPSRMQRNASSSSSAARTPQPGHMPPPSSIPRRLSSVVPALATYRNGSSGCATSVLTPDSGSVPKAGFNWGKLEQSGGCKTYELPKGLKIDRSKAGLFYFN